MLPPDELTSLKEMDEQKACGLAHFSLGMWLRNNWGLWSPHGQKNTLVRWFNTKGIYHADDMSGIILATFHRQLTGKPIDLEGQIAKYRTHWEKMGVNPDTMEKR